MRRIAKFYCVIRLFRKMQTLLAGFQMIADVAVKISKTKTKWLIAGKNSGRNIINCGGGGGQLRNIRTAYVWKAPSSCVFMNIL